jgi:hypothetical protein
MGKRHTVKHGFDRKVYEINTAKEGEGNFLIGEYSTLLNSY